MNRMNQMIGDYFYVFYYYHLMNRMNQTIGDYFNAFVFIT